MISAVIIVLREVLEAMLVICVLLASTTAIRLQRSWLLPAILFGITGAFLYAYFLEALSQTFDGVGQEILNAVLLAVIALLLVAYSALALRHFHAHGIRDTWLVYLLIGIVGLAMVREGAEIYIYIYAFGFGAEGLSSVLSGSAIGAGIGISLGTFIYFGLRVLLPATRLLLTCIFAVLMASGLIGQAVNLLIQADWLPAQLPLWDTSHLITESSLAGEFLQAMLGYEASPTPLQLGIYLVALAVTATVLAISYRRSAGAMDE